MSVSCIVFGEKPSPSLRQAIAHAKNAMSVEGVWVGAGALETNANHHDPLVRALKTQNAQKEQSINEALTRTQMPFIVIVDGAFEVSLSFLLEHIEQMKTHSHALSLGTIESYAANPRNLLSDYRAQPGIYFDSAFVSPSQSVPSNLLCTSNLGMRRKTLEKVPLFRNGFEGQPAELDYARRLYLAEIPLRWAERASARVALDQTLAQAVDHWRKNGQSAHALMAGWPDTAHRMAMIHYLQRVHAEPTEYAQAVAASERVILHYLNAQQPPSAEDRDRAFDLFAFVHKASLAQGFFSLLDASLVKTLLNMPLTATPDPDAVSIMSDARSA